MAFNADPFSRPLLLEALFYDPEYGAFANVSLTDKERVRLRAPGLFGPERRLSLCWETIA